MYLADNVVGLVSRKLSACGHNNDRSWLWAVGGRLASRHFKDRLHSRKAVLRRAGVNDQVRSELRSPWAVGVAAEHFEAAVGMASSDVEQRVADRLAGEVRRPVVVGQRPLVPARLPERGDVGEHMDVLEALNGLRQDRVDMSRGFVSERMQLGEQIAA